MRLSRRYVIVMIIAVVLVLGWRCWIRSGRADGNADRTAYVTVETGSIRKVISTTGTVEPQNRLEIIPPIAGRIEEIRVQEGQMVYAGDVLALMSSTERAALLDAAKLQGADEVEYWKTVYHAAPLIAPIGGTVIVRGVEPGQTVTTSNAVIVLSDRLIVKADLDETDIGAVALGQRALISLDAYPGIAVAGVVDHISYESELVNNVTIYAVDILPDEVPAVFRSGMSANVEIVAQEHAQALLVPQEAVQTINGQETLAVRYQQTGECARVAVKTGLQDEESVEILSGIAAGDQVCVSHQDYQMPSAGTAGSNPFMPARGRGRMR